MPYGKLTFSPKLQNLRSKGVKPISFSEGKVVSSTYISVTKEKCSARLGWLKNSTDKEENEEVPGTVPLILWSLYNSKVVHPTSISNGLVSNRIICELQYKYPNLWLSLIIHIYFKHTLACILCVSIGTCFPAKIIRTNILKEIRLRYEIDIWISPKTEFHFSLTFVKYLVCVQYMVSDWPIKNLLLQYGTKNV